MKATVDLKINRAVWRKRLLALAMTIAAVCLGWRLAAAQISGDGEKHRAGSIQQRDPAGQQSADAEQSPAHKYFTDVPLVNQNGERMRFYSDLLKGKVVIINSFFATCQGVCLPMNRNLEKIQASLGDRVGKDVHIISISVDPTIDTPARLKQYAENLHAKRGWHFLTGDKQNVDFALGKIGHFVNNREDHLNILIIGNERTGLWKKAFGMAPADDLIKVVESVLNDQPRENK